MLLKSRAIYSLLHTSPQTPFQTLINPNFKFGTQPISSLKVVWRKDPKLDEAIDNDKQYKLCARVVREVLNETGRVIPLRYLEKRRERLRLNVSIKTFLSRNPGLFETYLDRIKPKTELVPFLRASDRLRGFLDEEKRITMENESLIVSKLCKLLMMSNNKVLSADKLEHVKREFGFPNNFLVDLVPRYPEYFRLLGSPGEGSLFLELVSWNPKFAQSVIEQRSEEELSLTGIRTRPNFDVKLPPGFFIKKEMREWIRDWIELDYVSPYTDVSHLDQASPEMEKRSVGVFHELLSLSLLKRIPVPILGGIKTAMLREAYRSGELIDRDPMLEIKDKFVELLKNGWQERAEQLKFSKEQVEEDMRVMEMRSEELGGLGGDELL